MIHFTLELKPQPKQRPRFNTNSKRAFTAKETIQFERSVRTLAMSHISEPLKGAVRLKALFVYPHLKKDENIRPKRKYKETRPDLSNVIKSLEDGLESVAFNDDAQIVSLSAEKIYGALGESPHIEVTLEELTSYEEGEFTDFTANTGAETGERTHEDSESNGTNSTHSAGGEGGERTHEDPDPNRTLTAQERREAKDKRREVNRAEHRAKQAKKHEEQAKKRGVRKLEEVRRKLEEVTQRRGSEKREKEEAQKIAYQKEEQERIERYTPSRFLPDQEEEDE